ncbi:hypothetical protein BJX65DRAFT_304055 [Aspergillus insuetus]
MPLDCRRHGQMDHPQGVSILDPTAFYEASFLLFCRDYCHFGGGEFSWRAMWKSLAKQQVRLNRPLPADFLPIWNVIKDWFARWIRSTGPALPLSHHRRRLIAQGNLLAEETPEVDEEVMH